MMCSAIDIDVILSKSELCNVCANKSWVSNISFVLKNVYILPK